MKKSRALLSLALSMTVLLSGVAAQNSLADTVIYEQSSAYDEGGPMEENTFVLGVPNDEFVAYPEDGFSRNFYRDHDRHRYSHDVHPGWNHQDQSFRSNNFRSNQTRSHGDAAGGYEGRNHQ